MTWQPIEALQPAVVQTYILWNGVDVFTGWLDHDGQWHCDQYADHCSEITPPPSHWMPLPEPPK